MTEAKDEDGSFAWTGFYEAVAEKLLDYREDRTPLIEELRRIASTNPAVNDLDGDKFSDGSRGPLRDVCPFTVMGTFNRSLKPENRQAMARGLARFLDVRTPVPTNFKAVQAPVLTPQNAWFFPYHEVRKDKDIDSLWGAFAAGRSFAASPDAPRVREAFISAYDRARKVKQVSWNLTMGLYWSHPKAFPTLDQKSRNYLTERLSIPLPKQVVDGKTYVDLIDQLNDLFGKGHCPVHSFPEMSDEAWLWSAKKDEEPAPQPTRDPEPQKPGAHELAEPRPESPADVYAVADIERDGCFLEASHIRSLLERLRDKKNLILQGPPGTGKTWLGRRLAYALVGRKDARRVRAVQFHPNLSYEDFVRGYRPSGEGRLVLVDGVFMQLVRAARARPKSNFVLVIEEINRGHPAQIFGELLTLLEADKRNAAEALELSYADPEDDSNPPVHVPPNLYVVGTMNLADRSLALVDFALRRRFAFADLEPQLGERWIEWIVDERGVDRELAHDIRRRIQKLNAAIEEDESLGKQFRLGHSYVTPSAPLDGSTRTWFEQVARSEIGPQLDEYWFDSPKTAQEQLKELLKGW